MPAVDERQWILQQLSREIELKFFPQVLWPECGGARLGGWQLLDMGVWKRMNSE